MLNRPKFSSVMMFLGGIGALSVMTVLCGLLVSNHLYKNVTASLETYHLDKSLTLNYTPKPAQDTLLSRTGTLVLKDGNKELVSFSAQTSFYPFFVKTRFVPLSKETLEFFESHRIAAPVLSSSLIRLKLELNQKDKRSMLVSLPDISGSCSVEGGAVAESKPGHISPSDVEVTMQASSVLCGQTQGDHEFYLGNVTMKTTLADFMNEYGLGLPYFARTEMGMFKYTGSNTEFALRSVRLNHSQSSDFMRENLDFSFYLGQGAGSSLFSLKGNNDNLKGAQKHTGLKKGRYQLTLEGPAFNNVHNQFLTALLEDGYLVREGRRLVSVFDITYNPEEPRDRKAFTLLANNKEVDLPSLVLYGALTSQGLGQSVLQPKTPLPEPSSNAASPTITGE